MIAAYIILSVLFLAFALYVFVLVRPTAKMPKDKSLLTDYAHRGLHGGTIPENSLAAFEKAAQNGFGIELDVQLSKDDVVMVFHDYNLARMTGADKKLSDLTSGELGELSLANTDQAIPSFKEVLSLIDGRVPILVELKGENLNTKLCPKVAELLKDYNGSYCIESFNPLLIKAMRKYLPNAFYGQLYTNVCRDKKKCTPLNVLLTLLVFNFLAKPDFIAFNKLDRNSLPVKLATRFYKAPKFVWTVKTQKEKTAAKFYKEHAIFENV